MDYVDGYRKIMRVDKVDRDVQIMTNHFIKRTKQHISRVEGFMLDLIEFFPHYKDDLILRGKDHDKSKFLSPERIPYIKISWRYKCRKEGKTYKVSEEWEQRMRDASFYHCKHNLHHPEAWDDKLKVNPISWVNRDKPSGIIVDGTKMDEISMLEMVADWSAMSVEMNDPGPKKWADDNINVRWKFTPIQTRFIYDTIGLLWG